LYKQVSLNGSDIKKISLLRVNKNGKKINYNESNIHEIGKDYIFTD